MIPQELINLVAQFEGFEEHAYQDIGGVWTVGYGFTGPNITEHTSMTLTEARTELSTRLSTLWTQIQTHTHIPLTQNEMIALTDFAYNLGISALFNSHLWSLLQLNEKQAASDQFPLWCHVNGQKVQGLLNRREQEQKIFLMNEETK